MMLSEEALDRHASHLLLNDFSIEDQNTIHQSRIIIAGCGGLGGLVAMQLAGAGIGELYLFDPDTIERSNLQRQLFFDTASIGQSKAQVLVSKMTALNPNVVVHGIESVFPNDQSKASLETIDLVIDCTDQFSSRFQINQWCLKHQIPLVSGAAIESSGIIGIFCNSKTAPCYGCLVPHSDELPDTCHSLGVLSPLVSIVSSIQTWFALQQLTRKQHDTHSIYRMNMNPLSLKISKLQKDPGCSECGEIF